MRIPTPQEYFQQITGTMPPRMSPRTSHPYQPRHEKFTSKTVIVSQQDRPSPPPPPLPKLESNQISLTPFSVQHSPLSRQSTVGLTSTLQYRQRTDTCLQDTLRFHTHGISQDIKDFESRVFCVEDVIDVTDERLHGGDTPDKEDTILEVPVDNIKKFEKALDEIALELKEAPDDIDPKSVRKLSHVEQQTEAYLTGQTLPRREDCCSRLERAWQPLRGMASDAHSNLVRFGQTLSDCCGRTALALRSLRCSWGTGNRS